MNRWIFKLLLHLGHEDVNLLSSPTKCVLKELWSIRIDNLELLNNLILADFFEPCILGPWSSRHLQRLERIIGIANETNLSNFLMDINKLCLFHPLLSLSSFINGFAKFGACFAHTLHPELGVWCFFDGPVIA